VSLLHAHLVLVTTYRRRGFTDALLTVTETTMRTVYADLNAELVEFNGERDHVQLLVAYPPMLAVSVLAQRLKGRTAYAVRREFTGDCVRARMRGHLWSPSYCAVSCKGAPLSIIKQYIDAQARPL
jgi:putative transposase